MHAGIHLCLATRVSLTTPRFVLAIEVHPHTRTVVSVQHAQCLGDLPLPLALLRQLATLRRPGLLQLHVAGLQLRHMLAQVRHILDSGTQAGFSSRLGGARLLRFGALHSKLVPQLSVAGLHVLQPLKGERKAAALSGRHVKHAAGVAGFAGAHGCSSASGSTAGTSLPVEPHA